MERCLWRTLLTFSLSTALYWEVCEAQRVVNIQTGPLYRVVGYPLDISCNVSNVGLSLEQHFEFSIYEPSRPTQATRIVSTRDPTFSYAKYKGRVSDGDVKVERRSTVSVTLHVKAVMETDEGEYECHTPSLDGTYFGTYADKTKVHVIQDTLSVSSEDGNLNKTEGESLTLDCEVSSQTFQHTHLSVTWYLQGAADTQPKPIISFDRDLTLRPGDGFEDRYHSGLVSLTKVGGSTYQLSLSKLQVKDQGSIFCEGTEWIQDPDRTWTRVSQKRTKGSILWVQPLTGDQDAFDVKIEAPKSGVQEGNNLQIKCTVWARNLLERYFSVVWLRLSREVAHIGPMGVLSVSPDYESREREGDMSVVKRSDREYVLSIRPVRTEDQGQYQCRVSEQRRGEGGVFTQGPSKESSAEIITVNVTESKLVVTTENPVVNVTQGSMLRLTCRVTGSTGQVSITWQYSTGQGHLSDIITLSQSGVSEPTARWRPRVETGDVQVRRGPDSFTLEMSNVLPSDSGLYKCSVTDWVTKSNGQISKGCVKSGEIRANVWLLSSLIRTSLISRTAEVKENGALQLICKVKRPRTPLSVTWKFKHDDTDFQDIVLVRHTGDITWFREKGNYQLKAEVREADSTFTLRVLNASLAQGGVYQCVVETFVKNVQASLTPSNEVRVNVKKPESLLLVSTGPESPVEREANSDIQLQCRVVKATSRSSLFNVSWLLHREGQMNQTILSMDHNSVISGLVEGSRYSLRRSATQLYELVLQWAEPTDSGLYYCEVTEWLQDPHGDWYTLSSRSAALRLTVRHKPSEFRLIKSEQNISVVEMENVTISCIMDSVTATSHYAVTWFFTKPDSSSRQQLAKVGHDGILDSSSIAPEVLEKMHFYRTAMNTFSLAILRASVDNSGHFSCQVDEYQLDPKGVFLQKASDQSGATTVTVLTRDTRVGPSPTEVSLSVFAVLMVILLIVVVVLCFKLRRQSADMKIKQGSLWAESNPLKPASEL